MQSKFRLSSSQFFLTYPKCDIPAKIALEVLKHKFAEKKVKLIKYVVAEEDHKDGDKHLHAYVQYSNKLEIRKSHEFDLFKVNPGDDLEPVRFHGNYQSCRSAKNVVGYCVKGGIYETNMQAEVDKWQDKSNKMDIYKGLITGEYTVMDLVAQYPTFQSLLGYSRLKSNVAALRLDLKPTGIRRQVCGKWIVGPPAAGKSHFAREIAGEDLFVKLQTKWWCGYQGQKYVLLEDLSKPGQHSSLSVQDLAYFLKIWTDKWETMGETKGGANVRLVYKTFWVTSNYTIEEIFDSLNDAAILAAINRRFVVIPIISRGDYGMISKPDGYEDSTTQVKLEEIINPNPPDINPTSTPAWTQDTLAWE